MKKYFWLFAACSLAAGATLSCTTDSDSTCVLNEVKCEKGVIFTCLGINPMFVKGETCESGVCENVIKCKDPIVTCTPGEKQCKASIHRECNAAGNAWASLDCAKSNTFCSVEKACVECVVVGDCAAGSLDCKDNKCITEQVVVCTDGSGKCLDGKLYTCANNAWGNGADCGTTYECKEGNDQCTLKDSVGCMSGNTRCLSNMLETCSEFNVWGAGVACATGQECKVDATECTAVACTNDAKKCLDGKLHTCAANDWGAGVDCATDYECLDGNDHCTEYASVGCMSGNTRCLDGMLETCTEFNVWGAGVACATGQECKVDAKACTEIQVVACTNGDKKCVDNMLQTCANDVWGAGVACATGQECKVDAKACTPIQVVACTNGDKKCVDNKLQTCAKNVWGAGVACATGQECKDGATNCEAVSTFQCAFTVLEASPETASATGKVIVTKGVAITGGGLYCTDDLALSVIDWKRPATLPTKNAGYAGAGDEWQSGTVVSRPVGTNYCTYVVRLEDNTYNACPKSATLGGSSVSDKTLFLTADQTRTMEVTCGNAVINGTEECDGANIGTAVCPSGKTGTVSCSNECKLNYSACLDASIDYKYSENFSGFTLETGYIKPQTVGHVSILGAIIEVTNIIDGKTFVIADKQIGSITVSNLTAGIGTLTFQYKSWGADSFDPAKHKVQVFINDETTPSGELVLDGNYASAQSKTITINKAATKFSIVKQPAGTNNPPRILIDNINWSDKK